MKIAHIVWGLGTGGIETMLVDIVNEQVKSENVAVYVVNDIYDQNILNKIDSRTKIYFCKRKEGSKNPIPIIRFNCFLWQFHPDIIHCHSSNIIKAIHYPCKKVCTIHNTHTSCEYYKKYDKLFYISEAVKAYTFKQGFHNGTVIYNGIHTNQIANVPKGIIKNREKKRFVCIGRLHKDKGQTLIVEAFNELVNKRRLKGFSIDLIGEGELRNDLERIIVEYGLNSYVHLLGVKPREYFYPHLCEYDLLILPSISEGFGLTVAEAMAAKVPVLTSDLPGPMEVIGNGKYGFSFISGNFMSLADKIEEFLKNGKNAEIVELGYDYVVNNFDVKQTSEKYLREYKILKESRKEDLIKKHKI